MMDLIVRLRDMKIFGHQLPICLEAADEIASLMEKALSLMEQLEEMTKKRDELEIECAVHAACTKHRYEELGVAKLREDKLLESINAIQQLSCYPEDVLRICRETIDTYQSLL